MAETPTSIYQQLPQSTIRLLVLAPGDENAPLEAEFQLLDLEHFLNNEYDSNADTNVESSSATTSVSNSPAPTPYEALSYTWGEAVFPQTIRCNGFPISITQNLFDALIHIRNTGKFRTLWIDAICINQSDKDERSSQVLLMRHIFANCQRVIIWLGLEDENSCRALPIMETILSEAKRLAGTLTTLLPLVFPGEGARDLTGDLRSCLPCLFHLESFQRMLWAQLKLPQRDLKEFKRDCLGPIEQFCSRPWFSRVWTIQESLLPKRADIMIGKRTLSWKYFGKVLRTIRYKTEVFGWPIEEDMVRAERHVSHSRSAPTQWLKGTPRSWNAQDPTHYGTTFNEILPNIRSCKSTDPRDKIYGLLSLVSNDLGIQPDYGTAIEEVYADATRRIIFQESGSPFPVSILGYAGCGEIYYQGGFPSWVPKWHLPPTVLFSQHLSDNPCRSPSRYKAGGTRKQKASGICSRSIVLEGFVVGTVKCVAGTSHTLVRNGVDIEDCVDSYEQILELVESLDIPYMNGDSMLQVFTKILTAAEDRNFDHTHFVWQLSALLYKLLAGDVQKPTNRWKSIDDLPPKLKSVLMPRAEFDSYTSDISFHSAVFASLVFSGVFSTHEGYLGAGPKVSREDDLVCIFYNARQPFILRELEDGSFMLIGECYVHGIMEGEALEQGEKRSRTFMIR